MSDSLLQSIRQLSGGGIDLSKYTMTYQTGEQEISESIDNKKGYIYSYSFSALWFTGARFSWSIYDYDSRSYLVKREDCGSTNVLIFTDGNKYRIFHSSRVYSSKGGGYPFGGSFDVTSSSISVYATSGIGSGLYSSVTLAPKIENVATTTWITFLKTLSLVLSNLSSFNPFFSFERKSERKEKDNMSEAILGTASLSSGSSGEPKLLYTYNSMTYLYTSNTLIFKQKFDKNCCMYIRLQNNNSSTGNIIPVYSSSGTSKSSIIYFQGSWNVVFYYEFSTGELLARASNSGNQDVTILVYDRPLTNGSPFV